MRTGDVVTSTEHGNSQEYLVRRLKRDTPEVAKDKNSERLEYDT
jgi:hypothetical protein